MDWSASIRTFIRNSSEICAPLTTCMKKGIFQWTAVATKEFEILKKKVTDQSVLELPYFSKVLQVDCDSSSSTIGAVLSKGGRSTTFFSEKSNEAKNKYFVYVLSLNMPSFSSLNIVIHNLYSRNLIYSILIFP